MTIAASAPGKLILIGEYGVLFGGPAVVMAVDRRARVQLDRSEDSQWKVESPGLGWDSARFTIELDGSLQWCSAPEAAKHFVLFDRILRSLMDSGSVRPEAMAPFAATLDTRPFFHRRGGIAVKLGLGSSAALTVALASALAEWAGTGTRLEPEIEWLQRLLRLHRTFQGGRGSGVDLAASVMGGVVEYRLDSDGTVATAAPLDLPKGLHLAVVWTGRSADTGELLERLSRRMDGESVRCDIDNVLDRLEQIAGAGVLALRDQDAPSFLEMIDAFGEGLEALGLAAGLHIMSPEHLELRGLARRAGVHYKPSGAGGGDIGVGLADDGEALDRFTRTVSESGFAVLDVSLDPSGLR